MAPALQLRDFAVGYERRPWTIQGIDLELAAGECVGILGVNGAGKSSLALGLLGVIPQVMPGRVGGSIELAGLPVASEEPIEDRMRRVGYSFQEAESQVLFGTVRETLGLDNSSAGVTGLLEDAVQILRLGHLLDRPAEKLSGGEMMRVMLASALANQPPLLIFDEATSALDVTAKRDFKVLLERLRAEGIAVILMGQRREVLASYCTQMYRLAGGALELWSPEPLPVDRGWPAEPETGGPASTEVLRLADVRARRGAFNFGSIELSITPGETVALMGPNGGGKSTLLDVLGGGLRIIQGCVEFGGRSYNRRSWRKLANITASVTQSPLASVIGATVAEELADRCDSSRLQILRDHFSPTLDFLTPERDPLDLSFGQLRLLTFIVAVGSTAPIVTLDEPELGLDERSLSLILAWVRHERTRRGRTIILSTHDFAVAARADRVLLIDGGRIVAEQSVTTMSEDELREWYECRMCK